MLRILLILSFLLIYNSTATAQEVGDWIIRKDKAYLVVEKTESGVTVWNYWRDKNEKLNYHFSRWDSVVEGKEAGILALPENSIVQMGTKLNLHNWSTRRGIYHVHWKYHAKYGWLAYFGDEWIYILGK